jgi:hypothetical protein
MYLRQVTIGLALLLCATAATAAAPGKDQEPAGKATDNAGARIIIRSEAEKKRRQQAEAARASNENSNRQSDIGSERGLERAEERRPEQAGKQPEGNWFEDLLGTRKKPNDKPDKEGESRWWWPFD